MYHSWNLRKLLRYIAFDMALVLAAILLTRAGRQHFAAVDSAGGVSLPVLMYHSIAPVPETQSQVQPSELQAVVGKKGYFPADMPVQNYPQDFVEGWCIPWWQNIVEMIQQNRVPF